MASQPIQKVRCRQIEAADLGAMADLLAKGFPNRAHAEWVRALDILSRHAPPEGFPQYGYMLECEGKPVGVILLISTRVSDGGAEINRCNVSSWYVEPAFRSQAAQLNARVLKHQPATYLNITAAPNTWPIIEVQGFQRFRQGVFVAIPALGWPMAGVKVRRFESADAYAVRLPAGEIKLLEEHASYGCLCLCCSTAAGVHPFVFRPRRIKRRLVPCAQLIYCRELADFVRYAGPIGHALALRGFPFLLVDADGPVPGLAGKYFAGQMPFFAKGPDRPRSGDLAYTEAAMFGY